MYLIPGVILILNFKIEILKILLRDEKLADDVDLGWLSRRTDLFSGSDLKRNRLS